MNIPSTNFFRVLFSPFFFGGPGGLPFSGITGMSALAHHITDNGSAFIFYGRHISSTLDGQLGQMYRPRQEESGFCCGALMLALSRFKDPEFKPELKEYDYRQTMLKKTLFPEREEILAANNPEQKITEKALIRIEEMLYEYLRATKTDLKVERIALLGGIIINTDYGVDDYFEVMNKKHF